MYAFASLASTHSTMPNWYWEKKELRATPSQVASTHVQSSSARPGVGAPPGGIGAAAANKIDYETEMRYRREGARFIIELGKKLNLSHNTMATGAVYFHRFYMFHSFVDFPKYVRIHSCTYVHNWQCVTYYLLAFLFPAPRSLPLAAYFWRERLRRRPKSART